MSATPVFGLRIFPGRIELSRTVDGKTHSQPISLACLNGLLSPKKEFGYRHLPAGCRMVVEKPASKMVQIVVEFPAGRRKVKVKHDPGVYSGSAHEIEGVALPGGICVIDLYDKNPSYTVSQMRVFGLANTLSGTSDILYRYPVPNLDRSYGSVCWGGNRFETYMNLAAAEGLVLKFFESQFNNHLFYRDTLSENFQWGSLDINAVHEFFKKLADLPVFPVEWLKPIGLTLDQVLR